MSTRFSTFKKYCPVLEDYNMAYIEKNENSTDGPTLLFLHGNPTSSFLWRNIMEPLRMEFPEYRFIAPDLIGMGDSDKLNSTADPDSYRFVNHAKFLDAFIDCAIPAEKPVVLVLHDWGSALGFWWAYRNQERVQAIAYMESLVAPLTGTAPGLIGAIRTPGSGEQLILEQNAFVEQLLPASILRNLTEEEFSVYRAPYLEAGESRRPTLAWPREIPINGTPADTFEVFQTYSDWMGENDIPKLFVNAEPGGILVGDLRALARSWKNQVEVTVAGIHFIQEDSPEEIVSALADWLPVATSSTSAAYPSTSVGSSFASLLLVGSLMIRKALW